MGKILAPSLLVAMNAAIAVLRDYRKVLDGYEVGEIRAVATSAPMTER